MRISFDFDETTKKVSNLTVDDSAVKQAVKKKKPTNNKIMLNGSTLKLTDAVLTALGVSVGDRLCVRFNPKPVILRPDIANESNGGNLITKTMTLSCKGKTSELLTKFGTEFDFTGQSDGYVVLTATTEDANLQADKEKEKINLSELDEDDFALPQSKFAELENENE